MSERPRVDYHVHYNPADEKTAYTAIEIAKKRNVVAMTILARSQVSDNTEDFIKYGESIGVDIVPGVEFLGRNGQYSVDFILLGFDPQNKELKQYFGKDDNNQNKKRAEFQRNFLRTKGFSFSELDQSQELLLCKLLAGELSEKAINFCNIVAGIETNSELLCQLKEENSIEWKNVQEKYGSKLNFSDPVKLTGKFLYNLYFQVDKEGYQEVRTDSKTIIDVVHRAGGVVLYSPEGEYKSEIWENLQNEGIDGIMAWHAGKLGANGKDVPDISKKTIINARKSELLVLGGSDYQQKDWEIGIGNGKDRKSTR